MISVCGTSFAIWNDVFEVMTTPPPRRDRVKRAVRKFRYFSLRYNRPSGRKPEIYVNLVYLNYIVNIDLFPSFLLCGTQYIVAGTRLHISRSKRMFLIHEFSYEQNSHTSDVFVSSLNTCRRRRSERSDKCLHTLQVETCRDLSTSVDFLFVRMFSNILLWQTSK